MDRRQGDEGWVERRGKERGDTMWAKTKTGNKIMMKGKNDNNNNNNSGK